MQKLAPGGRVHARSVGVGFLLVQDGVHEALSGEERRFEFVRYVGQKLAAQGLQAFQLIQLLLAALGRCHYLVA